MLVVIGPCSIHDTKAALEYAERLMPLREKYADRMEIVMRVYFEKPRTTVGWKGLINDPHLDDSFDMGEGLKLARKLLIDITDMGMPAATEMLEPLTPQYIADLVSWAAIGARTTESQTHRQMASGLSMPVGFKNTTGGNLQVAIDAMKSASQPHRFLGIDRSGQTAVINSKGNPDSHLILRGGSDGKNYEKPEVTAASEMLAKAGLSPLLMVDCSHANSGKKHGNQEVVWRELLTQREDNDTNVVIGTMLESNLVEGAQKLPADGDLAKLNYGQSVTDECIGWAKTEELLAEGYDRLG